MPADPLKLRDWEIAEEAEKHMPTPEEWAARLGLRKDEIIPYGRVAKLDHRKILARLGARPNGKYIVVTAITPTPLGRGRPPPPWASSRGSPSAGRTRAAASASPRQVPRST